MNPSATKQYVINELPDDPGQITSNFVVQTVGGNDYYIYYSKVGKLYFGITIKQGVGGIVGLIGRADTDVSTAIPDSMDQIAALLGETVNTIYYAGNVNSDVSYVSSSGLPQLYYSGVTWVFATTGRPGRNASAFLAN